MSQAFLTPELQLTTTSAISIIGNSICQHTTGFHYILEPTRTTHHFTTTGVCIILLKQHSGQQYFWRQHFP